jgi:methylenetetrahydrofolate reductase (NADPH)
VSLLGDQLEAGALVVTAELPMVDGGGLDAVRRRAEPLAPWCDAVNATDNTAAHAHASPVAVSIALIGLGIEPVMQLGIEPVMQLVCRDRNRLALESDIVGAALHGVENIACLTGDDVTAGDEPEARRVFDLDGPQLVRLAATIAGGHYLSGRAIDPAPRLVIGAVENPAAPPAEVRVRRAALKAAAGARFLQLQICYHPDRLEAFVAGCRRAGVTRTTALLPTICLVSGAAGLRFMDERVPGISVPATTIAAVERSSDQAAAAYDLALEQARHALSLPGVAGLHLTSFRRDGAVGRLLTDLGIPPRAERHAAHAHPPAIALP